MYVEKRKGGNRLVHNQRVNGKPRKLQVCSLGPHETIEDALRAAVEGLNELLRGPRHAEHMVGIFEARMLDEYRVPLRKWHGGSIPSTEVTESFTWGGIRPMRERYESWEGHDPATVSEYAMDFIGLTGIWGTGVEEFMWDLHELDRLRAQATQAWKDVADRELKLVERIETLCSAKNGTWRPILHNSEEEKPDFVSSTAASCQKGG